MDVDILSESKAISNRIIAWRRHLHANPEVGFKEVETARFIAQELDQVTTAFQADWLRLVKKDNPDRLEATPQNLFNLNQSA